jgi:hypothetical protein
VSQVLGGDSLIGQIRRNGWRVVDAMVLHRYPVKLFVDLRATLRKGWNHEATLTSGLRIWSFILGVRVVQLYTSTEIFSKAWSPSGRNIWLFLLGRLSVVMMKHNDEISINDDHSWLFFHVRNINMNHDHIIDNEDHAFYAKLQMPINPYIHQIYMLV